MTAEENIWHDIVIGELFEALTLVGRFLIEHRSAFAGFNSNNLPCNGA
jgi:hypothetical protein